MSHPTPLPHDDLGHGEPVVLLHAFPFDHRMWNGQHSLSKRARLILPDMRGFGRAAGLPPPASIDQMADDVAALLDSLNIPRAAIAGLSMGGYVALSFASRYPDRLTRLGLCDTRASADSPQALEGRRASLETLAQGGGEALVDSLLPKLISPRSPGAVVAEARAIAASQPAATIAAAIGALRDRPDRTDVLASITVPTVVIVGEDDQLTPPDVARSMAEAIGGAKLVEIERAGHLTSLEAPEAFTEALAELLGPG